MARLSNHIEPKGAVAIARHYIRDLVYGANDGFITTFAVVAGAPYQPYRPNLPCLTSLEITGGRS